jgi:rod shape-determining protein MreD
MIKDLFLLLLGLIFLVLQSTWLAMETINPFRPDLIFILVIFLGTLNRIWMGLVFSILLGTMVDMISWGVPGAAMILYPLIFLVFFYLGTRTDIQTPALAIIAVLILKIFYDCLVYYSLYLFRDMEFTQNQLWLIFEQALTTMVISIPLMYLFKAFFHKKPSLI